MRVIIVGMGEVGSSIAEDLSQNHEVVVMDRDEARVDEAKFSMDLLALEGEATSLVDLEAAGIGDADMLIASTDNDETNIVCCNAAEIVGDPFTIARVHQPHLLETWNRSPGAFDVDYMVSAVAHSARTIANVAGLPAARDVDTFADGLVQLAEFEIPAESPVAGQTVGEADRFDSLTFVSVIRGDTVEIARGDTEIRPEDDVVVIGSPQSVQSFAMEIEPGETPGDEDIVVIGGSDIGFETVRLLCARDFRPRVIEEDADRAREIAEELPNAIVMESDATDIEFLTREHVGEADVLVAALTRDEDNLLMSLLGKQLGVSRAVAVVERADYVDLFETVGVDVAVNPRELTAEEITRFTMRGRTEKVALVHHDQAEALECELSPNSVCVGKTLQAAMRELPDRTVVGAIIRGGELVIPRGDTELHAGDHVIFFTETERVPDLLAAIQGE